MTVSDILLLNLL